MTKYVFFAFLYVVFSISLGAAITNTNDITKVLREVDNRNTLVLLNLAGVVLDSEISLGSQPWRQYVRSRLSSHLHDELTFYVFKNVPSKAMQNDTAESIKTLQGKNIPILGFTSRGRHEWYNSQINGVDTVTESALNQIGVDFSKSRLPMELSDLDTIFGDYFHAGIIYGTNQYDKGELLETLFRITKYEPPKVVFVDDKLESLKSVEAAMKKENIAFVGFSYSRPIEQQPKFDPMVANIQLDSLITSGKILSDEEARQMKIKFYSDTDPDLYFQQVVDKWVKSKEKRSNKQLS